MKITQIINSSKNSLSFEVFPPKNSDSYDTVSKAVSEIAALSPSYMSVTYGAGGGRSQFTASISQEVLAHGVTPLAHLTCITSSEDDIALQLSKLRSVGVENILALRGDIPQCLDRDKLDFHYAFELINKIKNSGDFCIGGACYPESHPESQSIEKDIEHLKLKVDSGCDFLTTQMFFDNEVFYSFKNRLIQKGIAVPVIPGIMPITSYSQLNKMVLLSGNELPSSFLTRILKYENDPTSFKQAGVEYAIEQARDIYAQGFRAIHIYSMNKPDVAKVINDNLKDLIK